MGHESQSEPGYPNQPSNTYPEPLTFLQYLNNPSALNPNDILQGED